MAVYYKFKSAKEFSAVSIPGSFISVGSLKERIAEIHRLPLFGKKGCEIVVSDAETHEVYVDEKTLIPRCASLLVCRVPIVRSSPLFTAGFEEPKISDHKVKEDLEHPSDTTGSSTVTYSSISLETCKLPEKLEHDDFGAEIFTSIIVPALDAPPCTEAEDCWKSTWKIPPPSYVCHRCNIPGHFIKYCPTNGDPGYDFGGIDMKSECGASDGSSISASKSNKASSQREKQSLSSTQVAEIIAPGLCCPVCKTLMKEAVFASKCCFYSFCDRCIKEHVISKCVCTCGAAKVHVGEFVPNVTLRELINHIFPWKMNNTSSSGTTTEISVIEVLKRINPGLFLYVSSICIKENYLLCKRGHHLFLNVYCLVVIKRWTSDFCSLHSIRCIPLYLSSLLGECQIWSRPNMESRSGGRLVLGIFGLSQSRD